MKLLSIILAFGLTIVGLTQQAAASAEKDFVWYCESDEATAAQKLTVEEIYRALFIDPKKVSCQEAFENMMSNTGQTIGFVEQEITDLSPLAGIHSIGRLYCIERCTQSAIDSIPYLPNLSLLYIENNALDTFPDTSKLPSLSHLYASDNPIRTVDFSEPISNIETLFIDRTDISDLSFIERMPKLSHLNISNTTPSILDSTPSKTSITRLVVAGMELSNCDFLDHFPNLELVDITSNKFTTIECFASKQKIRSLFASRNRIESIEGSPFIESLKELDISENPIKEFEFLSHAKNLRKLNLSSTNFSNWSLIEPLMTHMFELDLSGTPLSSISITNKKTAYWNDLVTFYVEMTDIKSLAFFKSVSAPRLEYIDSPHFEEKTEENCPTSGVPDVVAKFCKEM